MADQLLRRSINNRKIVVGEGSGHPEDLERIQVLNHTRVRLATPHYTGQMIAYLLEVIHRGKLDSSGSTTMRDPCEDPGRWATMDLRCVNGTSIQHAAQCPAAVTF
jgi:hypothetical protein